MKIFGKKVSTKQLLVVLGLVLLLFYLYSGVSTGQIATPFIIVGVGNTSYPGDTVKHTFTLTNTESVALPELDDTDGIVTKLYKSYRFIDPAMNIYSEQTEEITTTMNPGDTVDIVATLDVTVDTYSSSEDRKWGVVAWLTKIDQVWDRNSNTWALGDPGVVLQPIDINADGENDPVLGVRLDIQTPTPPPPISTNEILAKLAQLFGGFINFIRQILEWLT